MTAIASNRYLSPEIRLDTLDQRFRRADIEFHGVDHSGPSFEARVFVNNPSADDSTPLSAENGYAGSFHVFGHGGCFGDEGHCDILPRRMYDPRPAHQLTPARKVIVATDAIRRAIAEGTTATITVVPIVTSLTEKVSAEEALHFERLSIVTYR
jgi:hypothetical protein